MKTMWMKIRRKTRSLWTRFKAWGYGLLVAAGLATAPLIIADADDVNLSWDNATSWSDSTSMPIDDIDVTVVMHREAPLGGDISGVYAEIVRVPPTQEAYVHSDRPNGIHCYVAYHIAKNGIPGDYSDEVCKSIDVRKPGTITGMSAN